MPSVCFYFQVHQPYRLAPFSYFDIGKSEKYFDAVKNAEILKKVAFKCYLPTNELLLRLIEEHQGKFKISFSISGVALEQFKEYAPEVLESFQKLARTGCVEFLCETWGHTLAALYDEQEFFAQIEAQKKLVEELFGQTPTIFRNTELIYSDHVGSLVEQAGFKAVLAEGCDDILGWKSPNFVYRHPYSDLKILFKNYRLSDDIAFRFSNRSWQHWPLSAPTFANWLHALNGNGEIVNLFMDYETFGEHQWADSGIFDFLAVLPSYVLQDSAWGFATPSEVVNNYNATDAMHVGRTTSWADLERDTTAWNGNKMQRSALARVYALAPLVKSLDDEKLLTVWRKLLTSDHYYYMCTKWFADGDVHAYFSPFTSPYEAFMNFMNCLTDFEKRVAERMKKESVVESSTQVA